MTKTNPRAGIGSGKISARMISKLKPVACSTSSIPDGSFPFSTKLNFKSISLHFFLPGDGSVLLIGSAALVKAASGPQRETVK